MPNSTHILNRYPVADNAVPTCTANFNAFLSGGLSIRFEGNVSQVETQSDLVFAQSGGFGSRYLEREVVHANHLIKQPVRDLVANYFTSVHHPKRPMRLFSLPSANWNFESQIGYMHRDATNFIAVERNIGIMRAGLRYMPGRGRMWSDELFDLKCVSSDTASVMHSTTSVFFGLGRDPKFPTNGLRKEWFKKWRNLTAIWLDFTGQLCREIELTLPDVMYSLSQGSAEIPVAVTVMKAREMSDISNKLFALDTDRAGYIQRMLDVGKHRSFVVDGIHEYQSSVPMLVVLGKFVYRNSL